MKINASVKLCRTACGLSQVDLAERMGMTASAISLLESGKRKISFTMLERIAKAMDISEETIVFLAADKDKFVHINHELANEISESILQLFQEKGHKRIAIDTRE